MAEAAERPVLFRGSAFSDPKSLKKHPEIALTLDQNDHFRRIAIQLLTSRTSRKSRNLRRLKQIYTENDASESAIQRPLEDPQKTYLNRTHSRAKRPFWCPRRPSKNKKNITFRPPVLTSLFATKARILRYLLHPAESSKRDPFLAP